MNEVLMWKNRLSKSRNHKMFTISEISS